MIPIRTQILFKPFPPDEVTDGGLFIPESARKISNKGEIVQVGGGTKDRPMKMKPGMKAYRVQDWGEGVLIGGELHYLMDMDSVLALEN